MPDDATAPCITAAAAAAVAFALLLALATAPEALRGPGDAIGIKYSSRAFSMAAGAWEYSQFAPALHEPRTSKRHNSIFFCC